jgi:multiple sugar transport system substrate-binding protein
MAGKIIRNLMIVVLAAGFWIWSTHYTSCKKEQSNLIRISSWGDIQENTILEGLIAEFQKLHPDIYVQLDRVPFGDYVDKLLTQFAGGLAPDVIFVSAENLADFYPRNLLEPLTGYLKEHSQINWDDFYPTLMKWYTVRGDLYVLPRDIAPVCVLYYNQKAFDEAKLPYPKDDWTVQEFLNDAVKLTKRDAKGNTTQWGFVDDWAMPEVWIYALGGGFVDDPHNPTRYIITQPESVAGIQFRADMINKYKVMPSPASLSQQGGVGTSDMFVSGTAAMFLSGIWKTPMFRGIKNFKWDVVMSPQVSGAKRAVVGGSSGYGIVSTSKHKQAAWQLISFLSSPEGQKRFAATGLVQPALKRVAESPAFLDGKDPQNKKMLLKAVDYGIDMPIATNWREVEQGIIFPALDKVWMGKETAVEAAIKLDGELNKHPLVLQEKPNK